MAIWKNDKQIFIIWFHDKNHKFERQMMAGINVMQLIVMAASKHTTKWLMRWLTTFMSEKSAFKNYLWVEGRFENENLSKFKFSNTGLVIKKNIISILKNNIKNIFTYTVLEGVWNNFGHKAKDRDLCDIWILHKFQCITL